MTLQDQLMAYTAAMELEREQLPFDLALALAMLKRDLEPQARFFLDRERELALEFGQTDEQGRLVTVGNRLKFRKGTDEAEYERRHQQLCDTPAPEPQRRYGASQPERMRPCHLAALLPFLTFRTGGERT